MKWAPHTGNLLLEFSQLYVCRYGTSLNQTKLTLFSLLNSFQPCQPLHLMPLHYMNMLAWLTLNVQHSPSHTLYMCIWWLVCLLIMYSHTTCCWCACMTSSLAGSGSPRTPLATYLLASLYTSSHHWYWGNIKNINNVLLLKNEWVSIIIMCHMILSHSP